jgi:hypothetical protein
MQCDEWRSPADRLKRRNSDEDSFVEEVGGLRLCKDMERYVGNCWR